jgi:hypothetical protein
MAETRCGSVHESPVRRLPDAPKQKARKTKFRDLVSARQKFEPDFELPPLRIPAMCYRPNDGQNDSPYRSPFHADDK